MEKGCSLERYQGNQPGSPRAPRLRNISTGHSKGFLSRGGHPWEAGQERASYPLPPPGDPAGSPQGPALSPPCSHGPATSTPGRSTARSLSQPGGHRWLRSATQRAPDPWVPLCQKAHLQPDLPLDLSDSLLRQASDRSCYKYTRSSIKSPFIQMSGAGLELARLHGCAHEGLCVEQQTAADAALSGAVTGQNKHQHRNPNVIHLQLAMRLKLLNMVLVPKDRRV